jgi:hypothetical protein
VQSGQGRSPFTERNYRLRRAKCEIHASKDDVPSCRFLHRDQPRACLNCLGFYPFDAVACPHCVPGVRFERGVLQPSDAAREHFRSRTGACLEHRRTTCPKCLFGESLPPAGRAAAH